LKTFIGCDPHKNGGWFAAFNESIKDQKRAWEFLRWDTRDQLHLEKLLGWFDVRSKGTEDTLLLVEDQFIASNTMNRREAHKKARGALDLARHRGIIETLAFFAGVEVRDAVTASAWQPALFTGTLGSAKEREGLALNYANEIDGVILADHNFADAVCLADFLRKQDAKKTDHR
jgi:hypothetical protein